MGLDHLPQFGGQPGKTEKPVVPGSDASLRRPAALGAFLGGLSVKRVPNTRLLDVTFETTDPVLAAQVVNAHLNNFIEQNFRSRFDAATQASNWLAGQLNEMKIKVENAEDARLEYERDNQIWTIDEKSDISSQKLAELKKQLTEAQADRINKEAVYQLAQSGNYDAIAAVRESAVIQDILKQQTTLSAQYTDAVNQYGPKFPKVMRLQAQMKDLDQLITREKLNIGNQIEAEYRGSRQREMLLEGSARPAEGGSEPDRRENGAVQHSEARSGHQQTAVRRHAAEIKGSRHHRRLAVFQYPRCGSRADPRRTIAPE